MKKIFSLAVIAFMAVLTVSAQKTATLSSPSGEIKANVSIEEQKLYYSVEFNGKEILSKMPLSMTFSNGVVAGEKVKALNPKTKTVEEVFAPASDGLHGVELANAMLLSTWLDKAIDIPFDDELFYEELKKRIAISKPHTTANNDGKVEAQN